MKYALATLALVGLALLFWSVWDREALLDWIREARPLPFFALMALLPALGVPIKECPSFALMVKATPGVPAFVKNYGLGAAGVPFGVYFATSMSITGLYAALLILLGESLFDHDRGQALLVGGALLLFVAAFLWLRKRGRRAGVRREDEPLARA